ncbi:hypothetical protein O3M35_000199 [Rhynocoris fuscipes]|uniref:1-acylglycerol-3-phosphate O-acyltransferase n=1 Tax=Rhynocoris fuscipes TaxID=488301 RepID=A0AAW1DLS3_9HEMI
MIAAILLAIVLFSWILPHIIPVSHWLRYYVCYLTAFIYSFIGCLFFIVLIIILPKKYFRRCVVLVAQIISKILGIEWEFRNESNLMKNHGKGIFVANHQSMFDILGLLYISQNFGDCVPVTKKELYYFWPIGLLGYLSGSIFIDRGNSLAAITNLNFAANAHFHRYSQAQILIFPEGTRNKFGNNFLPFKKGAFRLAIYHQLPIFPIVISPYYFIQKNQFFGKGKIIINFLEPISTTNLENDDVEKLMEKTRTIMENKFNILKYEVNLNNLQNMLMKKEKKLKF